MKKMKLAIIINFNIINIMFYNIHNNNHYNGNYNGNYSICHSQR